MDIPSPGATNHANVKKGVRKRLQIPRNQWLVRGGPPPHSVLFRVRVCSFPPFESTPYISGLPKFLNPPFAGFSQAFPALETPLNPEHCSMYPTISGELSFQRPISQDRHLPPPPPPISGKLSLQYLIGDIFLCSKWDLRTQCSLKKPNKNENLVT